jgi:hypothetical protein
MAEIKGEMGFNAETPTNVITKEETMFQVGADGLAIPEKFPVHIYDRELDRELMEESLMLMEAVRKQKSIRKIIQETRDQHQKKIDALQKQTETETDEKKLIELKQEMAQSKYVLETEDIKTKVQDEIISSGLAESRKIIEELKQEIENQRVTKFVVLSPCTTSEAYLSFEKRKTIDNKETDDWVADLISQKCVEPKYSLEEAKRLRPDYKIAIKEAIMEASNYKVRSYRDIILAKKLEDKPLVAKKEVPI